MKRARAADAHEASAQSLPLASLCIQTEESPSSRPTAAELASLRELGRRYLGMSATTEQLAAVVALRGGYACEMGTGEGKTLVIALAALRFARLGRRVSVLTANDYLSTRDAATFATLGTACGLTSGAITSQSSTTQRRETYRADVLFTTIQELGYDTLRDRLAIHRSQRVLPTPEVVLVDEADATLIDEALTPLILARDDTEWERAHTGDDTGRRAQDVARQLVADRDYAIAEDHAEVELSEVGIARAEDLLGIDNLYDPTSAALLSRVNLALQANFLLQRDRDYLVAEGKVRIVSSERGRVATEQRFSDGLQYALELSEGLAPSPPGRVLDSATVGAILGGCTLLGATSATLRPVAAELHTVWGLTVVRVPPQVPSHRHDLPDQVFLTSKDRDVALANRVRDLHEEGRPVLIATQSVAQSEQLARTLREPGVRPVVLNAKNDAAEAGVIASAGTRGTITVSTQMSGRGVDIRLGAGQACDAADVRDRGGLAVVLDSRFHTIRIDAQVRGRTGRQGDPGTTEAFVSLTDPLIRENLPAAQNDQLQREGAQLSPRDRAHLVSLSQRVSESLAADRRSYESRFNRVLELQRAHVLRLREPLLGEEEGRNETSMIDEVDPDLIAALDRLLPKTMTGRVLAARTTVGLLDQSWSEHLRFATELRDGIALRSLAGEDPIAAFDTALLQALASLESTVHSQLVRAITGWLRSGVPSEAELQRRDSPSSTWTYMREDNPFAGSRIGTAVSELQRRRGSKLSRRG